MRRTSVLVVLATVLLSGHALSDMSNDGLRRAMLEAKQNAFPAAQYEEYGLNSDGMKKVILDHLATAFGASARQLGDCEKAFDEAVATRSTELERRGLSCRGSEDDARASFDSQVSRPADQLREEKCQGPTRRSRLSRHVFNGGLSSVTARP